MLNSNRGMIKHAELGLLKKMCKYLSELLENIIDIVNVHHLENC